jgi:hypothetical protein
MIKWVKGTFKQRRLDKAFQVRAEREGLDKSKRRLQ